jgi:putative ABC transport system substrate-binding protein
MLQETDQPFPADRVEKASDVGVEYPVHLCAADSDTEYFGGAILWRGADITGVSSDPGLEFYGKVLGILAETKPKLSRVGYLASQHYWEISNGSAEAARTAARHAGISLTSTLLGTTFNEAAYRRAFDSLEQDRVDGLMVSSEAEHFAYRVILVELAAKSRIPAIYPFR